MNYKLALALLLIGTPFLRAEPELSGVFVTKNTAQFVLVDHEAGLSSGWLKIGDEFSGYTLADFRTDPDTLILKRGDRVLEIGLQTPTIKDARIALQGIIHLGGGQNLDVKKATLIYDQEAVFPLSPGVTLAIKATKLADGNVLYATRFEVARPGEEKETLSAPRITARPGQTFSIQCGEYSFELQQ